jgi:hypothetical protein
MKFVTGSLVSPTTNHYGTATTHTNSLAGVMCSGSPCFPANPPYAPEIMETARALKDNPDTIFDFVHNGVETEFAFGERKGAIGTLIDKSGTPFDQNVLFVQLARAAGLTAQYRIGQVTMTQAEFGSWTGGVTDVGAACRLLSSGGIPASFTPTNPPTTCAASGSFSTVTLLHIWSQVEIGGTWYAYDPSFKSYANDKTSLNLISASGLSPGKTATEAATGMSSGTSGGAPYIQNVGSSSLDSYLTTLGTTLLGDLQTNAAGWDTDEVTSIDKIVPVWAPPGGWRYATPSPTSTGPSSRSRWRSRTSGSTRQRLTGRSSSTTSTGAESRSGPISAPRARPPAATSTRPQRLGVRAA